MKTNLMIERNEKLFPVIVDVNDNGRGTLEMGQNTVPCQLTENTMDLVRWGIWDEIVCQVSNLTDEHGRVMGEGGKSILKINAIRMS